MFISNHLDSRVHCSQVTRPQFLPLTQMLQFCFFFVPARNEGKDLWGDDESGGDHWRNVVAKNKQTNSNLPLRLPVFFTQRSYSHADFKVNLSQTLRPPPDIHSHSFEARWKKKRLPQGHHGTTMAQQWHSNDTTMTHTVRAGWSRVQTANPSATGGLLSSGERPLFPQSYCCFRRK